LISDHITSIAQQIFAHLLEANVLGVFPEALATDVQSVFTDETVVVGTGPAGMVKTRKIRLM
jgi:ribulose 1,5-bisphosphate synthetase/thiazole synthase